MNYIPWHLVKKEILSFFISWNYLTYMYILAHFSGFSKFGTFWIVIWTHKFRVRLWKPWGCFSVIKMTLQTEREGVNKKQCSKNLFCHVWNAFFFTQFATFFKKSNHTPRSLLVSHKFFLSNWGKPLELKFKESSI